jgi:anti-anti-sigma regulatory factor
MLRIEKESQSGVTVLRLIGRIRIEHLAVLTKAIAEAGAPVKLDLYDVALVDLSAVRFLGQCESQGVELSQCSAYIREWIARETQS